MWIALSIAGGVIGFVVVVALVGLALPRGHVAARGATFATPPDRVWEALVDVEGQPRWRRGLARVERISPVRFREHGSHGAILFEVVEERPRELRITRIADDALPFGGRWIYELAPSATGTRLIITEDGFISNPVFRVLSRTVFSTSATMERFLADLGSHLGAPVVVEPAEPSRRVASR